jgi:5-methyltetrahydropteroyltriglutamate--homocysteine methyltransferase
MKTSTDRILTTHVGSIPRPESVRELLRARLAGQPVDESELAARVRDGVADVVRRQAEAGIDVVSDGEISKTSFLGYTDDRLTGFTPMSPDDPSLPAPAWSAAVRTSTTPAKRSIASPSPPR